MTQDTQIHRIGYRLLVACAMLALILICNASAQTTALTYQGELTDNGNPANGQYDFQFKLFDTSTVGTGTQLGSTATVPTVQVIAGIFTVQLDFGVSAFPGAARFLEIAVKQTGGSTFTTLGPRQPVTSNPYAIRSLNSETADGLSVVCLGCITSSQIQTVQGSQVTGLIPVASIPPGSDSYVQNTNTEQASVNFNIGGTGTANILDATAQFNLLGSRVLSQPGSDNLFAGFDAGLSNTTGAANSFFGQLAGFSNTSGSQNAFFGQGAGGFNTSGAANSFFGLSAGLRNTTGGSNAFFGSFAGNRNTTGSGNSFFGFQVGQQNTTGDNNSYFGLGAGQNNTEGSGNSFFGNGVGFANTTGGGNSFFGANAAGNNTTGEANSFFGASAGAFNQSGDGNTFIGRFASFSLGDVNTTGNDNTLLGSETKVLSNISNATAIGNRAQVTQSNSLVLGGITGVNGGTDTNVGIGTTVPRGRLEIVGNWDGSFGAATVTGDRPTIRFSGGAPAGNQQWILHLGSAVGLIPAGSLSFFNGGTGGAFSAPAMALTPSSTIVVSNLGAAGATALCRNGSNEISTCSSSLRYKTNLAPYRNGLDVINRLKPITFTWNEGGARDIGLGAEDVEKVEPLLTFRNDKGEIEGVKYGQLTVVLINAVKQQQAQIEALKKLVCADHPNADVCR